MTYQDRKDYYLQLQDSDILSKTRVLLESYGYYIRDEDEKIYADLHVAWDYPWHHVERLEELDCHTWHRVMFDIIGGFVPSKCQNCFKVVVKPKTLKQLFALLDLQIRMKRPSKCGIEDREAVFGNYGGYFYNRGLDAGVECYKVVKEEISNDSVLQELLDDVDENKVPVNILLKRGCTEFEHKLGRSDQWTVTEEQKIIEQLVNDSFVRGYGTKKQPDKVIKHVHSKWCRFAWDRGDKTVFEFTGKKHIHSPYMLYHYLAENIESK